MLRVCSDEEQTIQESDQWTSRVYYVNAFYRTVSPNQHPPQTHQMRIFHIHSKSPKTCYSPPFSTLETDELLNSNSIIHLYSEVPGSPPPLPSYLAMNQGVGL